MNNEEKIKDILFQIDMQLYDEFNDKFCEINEHLGDIYTYKNLEDLKQAEKDKERKLLREAIKKQEKIIIELDEKFRHAVLDDIVTEEYISKEKIRNKMNEIMNYTFSSKEERNCQNYAYDRLKEILGE